MVYGSLLHEGAHEIVGNGVHHDFLLDQAATTRPVAGTRLYHDAHPEYDGQAVCVDVTPQENPIHLW
jgi:hypothetical protein